MKNSIKKKFIDILFEPDDDEEQDLFVEETVKEIKKKEIKEKRESEPAVKAKDILYKKPEKTSAFINLDETKPVKNEVKTSTSSVADSDYEFSSQISPIFGVLKESQHVPIKKRETDESLVNKPESSHLEIITSPIFGYGQREGEYDIPISEEDELHYLFDEGRDETAEHTFDDFESDDEISLFNSYEEEQ